VSCCQPAAPPQAAAPWGRLIAALFVAGNSMVLSLAINISDLEPPERRLLHVALLLATVLVVGLVGGFLGRAVSQGLRAGRLGIEGLFASGITGATAYSTFSLWTGDGPTYFEVVSILLVIYALSAQIKQRSQAQLQAALRAAMPQAETCWLVRAVGQAPERVAVAQVKVGQSVRVEAGEVIPVDGVILSGEAFINEANLTGDGLCRSRRSGDAVLAGSRNVDGELVLRATVDGNARQLDRLFFEVGQAGAARFGLASQVEQVASWFFFVVAAAALATFGGWWVCRGLTPAFLNAMAVLLVACPCALGFATPIGFWTAAIRLARCKLYTRSSFAIERLAAVDQVLFDKTGTLTAFDPAVCQIHCLPAAVLQGALVEPAYLHAMIRATQSLSDHPIARIFHAMPQDPAAIVLTPISARIVPGCGIEGVFAPSARHQTLKIGDLERLASPADRPRFASALAQFAPGSHVLAIYVDGVAAALAEVIDRPIDKAAEIFEGLKAMHIGCSICSGDDGRRLGYFSGVEATGNMLPDDKTQRVEHLQGLGRRVCFVGDGINDAPAMSRSHASVGISSGTSLAIAAADFTLAQADLIHLPEAIRICRQTLKVVRSNLWFAVVYNTLGIGVAAAGLLHPVFAALWMVAASLTVTLRSAKLLNSPPSV
jgi:heavy metal translocating P-type ATPase